MNQRPENEKRENSSGSGAAPVHQKAHDNPSAQEGINKINQESQPEINPGIQMPDAPQMELPKGGGAIRGIGEKFEANPVTGTASFSVPLAMSPGRGGFTPSLGLSYNSGGGNSPFGLGWNVGLANITRKTDKGLPRYADGDESDTFIMSGAEDLVPLLEDDGTGNWSRYSRTEGSYRVLRYRPRTEGSFAIIERWEDQTTHISHWKTITRNNITSLYGQNANSRVSDPDDSTRVFRWNLEKSWDDRGNVMEFEYKAEDGAGVDATEIYEKTRVGATAYPARYLKQVRYGNTEMHDGNGGLNGSNQWLFYLVLDYGEHDLTNPGIAPTSGMNWNVRQDPYSYFKPGFDLRHWRLCRRVLMFHNIAELKDDGSGNAIPALVKATELSYDENPTATQLLSVQHHCFNPETTPVEKESYPPVEFTYSEAQQDETVYELSLEDLEEIPGGVNGAPMAWKDLYGEGLPGILADYGTAWYYKRNTGAGPSNPGSTAMQVDFEPFKEIAQKPMPGAAQQLQDIDGDGSQEVVLHQSPLHGKFKRDHNGEWLPFEPFESTANINWQDPNLRMLDLDGDGLADLLITTDNVFQWYRNKEGEGYEEAKQNVQSYDDDAGPHLVFSDASQSIYTADMSGDGLTDLLRIQNGSVCYWPNLGYGKFGSKIAMAGDLHFDHPDNFDQQRVRLADVDGSGTIDIIYLGTDKVSWWANQAGNRLSLEKEILNVPDVDNMASINVMDLLGRGIACLVWSSPLKSDYPHRVRYIDLMGQKPYLLTGILDNMGSEQKLFYTASTEFYIEDYKAGNPWKTKLPFPVQVLKRAETFDYISETRLVTRYAYHHGYYDREEREFRGFSMVEQWDTEEIDHLNENGLFEPGINEGDTYKLRPVYAKSWFHNGATPLIQPEDIANEYFSGDANAFNIPDHVIPTGLNTQEWREAYRSLRGSPLRSEVYHINDDGSISNPYTISQSCFEVKKIQPVAGNRYASFMTLICESFSYHYENNLSDPRISQQLVLENDLYGIPTLTAQVAYERVGGGTYDTEQGQALVSVTRQDLVHLDTDNNSRRLGIPYRIQAWELTGATGSPFGSAQLKADFNSAATLNYEDSPTSGLQKRLLSKTEAEYYSNDLSTTLAIGTVESKALLKKVYQLALTDSMKTTFFGSYSQVTDSVLTTQGGYVKRTLDCYLSSPIPSYDEDLFYLPDAIEDIFGNSVTFTYDSYGLAAISSTDTYGNSASAAINYRVLAPWQMTDPNGNRQQVAFDTRGMVVKMAVMNDDGTLGDSLSDPTGTMSYSLFNWKDNNLPNYVHSQVRETHRDTQTRWLETYTYTDGLGREILQKAKAEPGEAYIFENGQLQTDGQGDPLVDDVSNNLPSGAAGTGERWVGSGRVIYNNKGLPVKQYEPYFTNSPEFEQEDEVREFGVSPEIFYDSLGRAIEVHYPDGTFEKTEFDCWQQLSYDRNDTVADSTWYSDRNSPLPTGSEPTDPEERAAWLAAHHQNTPRQLHLDVLGRVYKMQDDNTTYGGTQTLYDTSFELDIEGKQRSYTNALGQQTVFIYDIPGNVVYTDAPDSGERILLTDAAGKPMMNWDERGHFFEYSYDDLQRPLGVDLTVGGNTKTIQWTVYGDNIGLSSPEDNNFRGQVLRAFDQSGVMKTNSVDFKGNLLSGTRQLATDFSGTIDWNTVSQQSTLNNVDSQAASLLESKTFTIQTTYDALNRPTLITQPDGSEHTPAYNEAGLLESMDVQLQHESNSTSYVTNINYDAKGQRTDIYYGNGSKTRYDYDENTFRLTRLLTTRNTGSDILQDLNYTYDPVGNIVQLVDNAQQTQYFSNTVIAPEGKYQYDSLYRLLKSTGREKDALPMPGSADYTPDYVNTDAQSAQTLRTYCEQFTYDALGNIEQLSHRATCGGTEHWKRNYQYTTNKPDNYLLSTYTGAAPPGTAEYTYDAHGNMLQMPHLSALNWDFADQLKSSEKTDETTHYVYSGGERVRKVVMDTSGAADKIKYERIYLGGYELYREYDSSENLDLERETHHVIDDQRMIALLEVKTVSGGTTVSNGSRNTITRYQYTNHLESACLELDDNADIISYEEFHPFGTTSYSLHTNDSEVSQKRYRYVHKERDEETGMDYYGARYYAAWLCRFVSVDPLNDKYPFYSSYQYAGNKPITFIDLDGLEEAPSVLIPNGSIQDGTSPSNVAPHIKIEQQKQELLSKLLGQLSHVNEITVTHQYGDEIRTTYQGPPEGAPLQVITKAAEIASQLGGENATLNFHTGGKRDETSGSIMPSTEMYARVQFTYSYSQDGSDYIAEGEFYRNFGSIHHLGPVDAALEFAGFRLLKAITKIPKTPKTAPKSSPAKVQTIEELPDYAAKQKKSIPLEFIDLDLEQLQATFEDLAEEHLLPQFRAIDPNLKAGYTGSFKTGIVGNSRKPTFGESINLNNFDIDYWIESDVLYEKFGGNLKANPEFRKILNETLGFEGLKPNKQGFSIKFKPSQN